MILLENAHLHVTSKETIKPVAKDDECCWPYTKCLFYITDRSSGLKFIIDMGAKVSVVSRSHTHRKIQSKGPSLQAINNTTIPTYGTCSLTLNLELSHMFRWVFIVADIFKAILGADFLKYYGFSVDMKSHRPLDPLKHLKAQGVTSSVTSSLVLSLLPMQPKSDYEKILMDFPAITSPYIRKSRAVC